MTNNTEALEAILLSTSHTEALSIAQKALLTQNTRQPDVSKLVEAAKECADDLESEIEYKYSGTKLTYPSEAERYERDILPVRKFRQALAEWEKNQ